MQTLEKITLQYIAKNFDFFRSSVNHLPIDLQNKLAAVLQKFIKSNEVLASFNYLEEWKSTSQKDSLRNQRALRRLELFHPISIHNLKLLDSLTLNKLPPKKSKLIIKQAAKLSRLQNLTLRACTNCIFQLGKLTQLNSLTLDNFCFKPVNVQDLAHFINNGDNLYSLNLINCDFSRTCASFMLEAIKKSRSIKELTVSSTLFTGTEPDFQNESKLLSIIDTVCTFPLLKLDLSKMIIGDEGLKRVAINLNSSITCLNLSNNGFTLSELKSQLPLLVKKVKSLNVSWVEGCEDRDSAPVFDVLLDSVYKSSKISEINMSYVGKSSLETACIIGQLMEIEKITSLSLQGLNMSDEHLKIIQKSLAKRHSDIHITI